MLTTGLVSHHKEKVAAERKAELEQRRQAAVTFAATMIAILEGATTVSTDLRPKPGELVINGFTPVSLFEPRSSGGHYAGQSSGISVPVGGGVRLRYGQSRGHYVRNPEVPTVIDNGSVAITDKRMVFLGTKRTMEWSWTKLVGLSHDPKHGSTAVQVTNRQKVSGVVYGPRAGDGFRTCLELALACYDGHRDAAIAELRSIAGGPTDEQLASEDVLGLGPGLGPGLDDDDLEGVTHEPPPPPAPALTQASPAPAAWVPDPTHRHQYRFWSGTGWTEHVSDNGASFIDPI